MTKTLSLKHIFGTWFFLVGLCRGGSFNHMMAISVKMLLNEIQLLSKKTEWLVYGCGMCTEKADNRIRRISGWE